MTDQWFYLDVSGAQFGPASASEVREALRQGRTRPEQLAWRQGMGDWQPIASLGDQLGLTTTPTAHDQPPADPYRAPEVEQMQPIDRRDVVYAGFLRRFAAWFLDMLILAVTVGLLMALFGPEQPQVEMGDDVGQVLRDAMLTPANAFSSLLQLLAAMLYFTLQESSSVQATVGKRAMGIKVTDLDGNRLGFGRALGRWVAATLSYLTLMIGFVMAAFTARKQALHDVIAGTLVVDQWAYSAHPERQKRDLSGCGLALLLLVLALVALAIAAVMIVAANAAG